jgi:hypothetical protein
MSDAQPAPGGPPEAGRARTLAPLAGLLDRAERCQYEESPLKRPMPLRWLRAARIWARRKRLEAREGRAGFGPPSRFEVGELVRVRDEAALRATLDAQEKLRGLIFMPSQWSTCGRTYTVQRVVRRMIDDSLRMRPISRAVMLEGVTCDDGEGSPGCGAACAMIFKDDWLESVPAREPSVAGEDGAIAANPAPLSAGSGPHGEAHQLVRVRSAREILGTLEVDGRLGGISPSRQMLELEGQSFHVARRREYLQSEKPLERAFPKEWYILEGVRCDGRVLGSQGPCDRLCGLLWHESWLEFPQAAGVPAGS